MKMSSMAHNEDDCQYDVLNTIDLHLFVLYCVRSLGKSFYRFVACSQGGI